MAIENKVGALIDEMFAKKGETVTLTRVQEETGLSFATVSRWYKGTIDRVNFETLDVWCGYLGCEVGDLLKHKPTKKGKAKK